MGGKPSKTPKSELNRSKSFSQFGRSSQRSLFQKSKARLNQINNKLQKYEEKDNSAAFDEIKKQLESVENDLNDVSEAIKEKNKQKYEEVMKYFQETRQKLEGKTKSTTVEENFNIEQIQKPPEPQNCRQHVELTLVKVIAAEDSDIELRNPLVNGNSEENLEQPRSPKVKFGVQVMPINPRVSQELLKRNTLPINEAPKEEFLNIRKRAESDGNQQILDNKLYNFHLPKHYNEEDRPPPGNSAERPNSVQNSSQISPNSISEQETPFKELERRQVNVNALQKIDSIIADIDVLEDKLKYFHGIKGDPDYIELHERFVRGLLKLDNIDAQGDSVVRQERKISIHRVQELIKILEYLVKEPEKEEQPNVAEDSTYDLVEKQQEEVVNAEGKPITATAL